MNRICNVVASRQFCYCQKVSRGFSCSRSWVRHIIKQLVRAGLIVRFRRGRIKEIRLTHNGEDVCSGLRKVENVLKKHERPSHNKH